MKIKELIEMLSTLDMERDVEFITCDNDGNWITLSTVEHVETEDTKFVITLS